SSAATSVSSTAAVGSGDPIRFGVASPEASGATGDAPPPTIPPPTIATTIAARIAPTSSGENDLGRRVLGDSPNGPATRPAEPSLTGDQPRSRSEAATP